MKHSVVLANFNGEQYLRQTIDSIMAQEEVDFEVLLVDDASTDRSLDICAEYCERHSNIKLIRHERNRGQGAGFNTGFLHSEGDIVSFIDSDDVWFPEKLRVVERAFAENPELGIFQHNLKILEFDAMTDQLEADGMFCGDLYAYWRKSKHEPAHMPTSALSITRSVLERILPMPELRIQADTHLWLTAIIFGPVESKITPHGAYRRHDSNNYYNNDFEASDRYALEVIFPGIQRFYDENAPETPPIGFRRKSFIDRLLDVSPRSLLRRLNLLGK